MAIRVLLVWAVVTGALHLLDVLLPGFAMTRWWQPTACALLLGVLTAVVWPLVLRIAMPLVFFTLGLASYVLLGAGVLAVFNAVPGVQITQLRVAVVVIMTMSAVNLLVSSLLAIDRDELFFRRAARRAARRGEFPDGTPPGVIFLQVDGLAHEVAQRAIRDGDMPTLAAWVSSGSHQLRSWHTDWSSQTGASVSGMLHGSNHDILGFRWYEKDRDHVMACSHPRDAAEMERRISDGKGLLAGDGATRGSLFSGDAPHTSMTMSTVPALVPGHFRRNRVLAGSGYYTYFALPGNTLRTLTASVVDIVRELVAASRQRRAGVLPRVKRGGFYPIARAVTTVIARDIVVSAAMEDMLAGRAALFVDFMGYDEVAHHSGVERFDTLATLRGIDLELARLHRMSKLAPRPYHLVVLSDHGQTQGWAYADRFGETVERTIGRLCDGAPEPGCDHDARRPAEGWMVGAALAEAASGGGPISRQLRNRVERAGTADDRARTRTGEPGAVARAAPGVVVVASGHMAMVSFTEYDGRVGLETIEQEFPRLLPALLDHDGIGFLLVRSAAHGSVVLGREGVHRLSTGVVIGDDPLADYGEHAADLVRRFDEFPHCSDIVLNSRYDPAADHASPFEPHVGSHGGMGGPQSRGFLLHPKEFSMPGELVGAESLYRVFRGWLSDLGHPDPGAQDAATSADSTEQVH
jgi:uncharacterized membrane protein YvlD (DUF360 family)